MHDHAGTGLEFEGVQPLSHIGLVLEVVMLVGMMSTFAILIRSLCIKDQKLQAERRRLRRSHTARLQEVLHANDGVEDLPSSDERPRRDRRPGASGGNSGGLLSSDERLGGSGLRSERRPGAYRGGDGSLLSSDERLRGNVSRSDRGPGANSGGSGGLLRSDDRLVAGGLRSDRRPGASSGGGKIVKASGHDRGHPTSSDDKPSDVEAVEPVCTDVGGAGIRSHSEQPWGVTRTLSETAQQRALLQLSGGLGSFAENGRHRTVAKPRQAPKLTSSGSRYYAELVRRQSGYSPDAPSTPLTPVSVPVTPGTQGSLPSSGVASTVAGTHGSLPSVSH